MEVIHAILSYSRGPQMLRGPMAQGQSGHSTLVLSTVAPRSSSQGSEQTTGTSLLGTSPWPFTSQESTRFMGTCCFTNMATRTVYNVNAETHPASYSPATGTLPSVMKSAEHETDSIKRRGGLQLTSLHYPTAC
jgi:hypothetical protein